MWLYEWKLFIVCHHPYKFGGHRYCGSGGITFLIVRVVSQDDAIKESIYEKFMGRSHLRLLLEVIILPSLEAINRDVARSPVNI